MTSRPFCPRCGKRTLYLAESQPEYDERGKPTGSTEQLWECVQCDGYQIEHVAEPSLTDALNAAGYTHEAAGTPGKRFVLDADNVRVFTGRSREVWAWLREVSP